MTYSFKFKLMVATTMSLSFFSTAFAQDAAAKKVEETKSAVMSAAARKIQQHSIGIGMGQTFLMGNFEKKGDDKITTDFLYAYTASYSFDLLINYHNSEHAYKNKKVFLSGITTSIKARSYEFDAFSPFIVGGLGFYQPQIEEDDVRSDAKNTFGVNAGGGADLRLNEKVQIGVLGQWHKPFDVKQDETATVRGSYFKLLLTAMYLF